MPAESGRFRLNLTTRELEIEGPAESLKALVEEYLPLILSGASTLAVAAQPTSEGGATSTIAGTSFGEFLHGFPDSLTGAEKALVAAAFVQANGDDNTFSTGDVSSLLKQHGIRLANPSTSVKRMVAAKHAFPVSRGKYRVSTEGQRALDGLKRKDPNG